MPCTAKTTNSTINPTNSTINPTNSTINPTNLHTRVLRNWKIPTPQQVSTPHDMALACPPREARCVKLWPAAEPPEGWEEHMFGYRDRRRSLTPCTSLASTPSPLPPKENHIQEDAEMSTPKKSSGRSEVEVEGDEGCAGDSGSDDQPDDGDDNNSSLPSSSPPPFQPSDSSDVEDELPSVHKSTWTSGKGKALDDICDFASKVKKEAEELRQCHGRSMCDILVAAGFGMKPSHTKLNEANLFRSWYWATQPKPDGAKRDTINDIITKEYKSLIQDIPKDDTAARREKLKHVYEWSENSSTVPTSKSVKSITARVQNAKMQFSGLAKAWSNLEEIEIAGVVMYVGQDPAGCQTSGIFGGSDMVRNFINQHAVDVCAQMDKYTSVFKYLRDGGSPEAGLPGMSSARGTDSSWELCCHMWEIPRDRNCRVFGSMMKEKLMAALKDLCVTQGIEVGNPQKIAWQCLLEFMMKNYLIILNWPHGVSPPGPGFEYKKLKGDPLRKLVVPSLCQKLGAMYDGPSDDDEEQDSLDGVPEIEIRPWNQDVIKMSESPNLKGEIPLIKAADGVVLRRLMKERIPGTKDEWTLCNSTNCLFPLASDLVQKRQMMTLWLHTLRIRKCLKGMLALFREATEYGTLNCNLQIMMRAATERGTHNARKRTLLVRPITWLCGMGIFAINMLTITSRAHPTNPTMQCLPIKMSDLTSLHPINSITTCHPALTLMITMMPTPQNWGNRGNILQYKDEILGDYVEEDY
ncbi:hypothetical protein BKA83DRAFT_4132703 [Pisolithus microcarpus]|nr:hypothetical protein BKA83DRAFT_4132703 [Pisolithus microcarpus]